MRNRHKENAKVVDGIARRVLKNGGKRRDFYKEIHAAYDEKRLNSKFMWWVEAEAWFNMVQDSHPTPPRLVYGGTKARLGFMEKRAQTTMRLQQKPLSAVILSKAMRKVMVEGFVYGGIIHETAVLHGRNATHDALVGRELITPTPTRRNRSRYFATRYSLTPLGRRWLEAQGYE